MSVLRFCEDCEDDTPHKRIGCESMPGRTWQCLMCPERREIEAALGRRSA